MTQDSERRNDETPAIDPPENKSSDDSPNSDPCIDPPGNTEPGGQSTTLSDT